MPVYKQRGNIKITAVLCGTTLKKKTMKTRCSANSARRSRHITSQQKLCSNLREIDSVNRMGKWTLTAVS